ncbi:MULTISPECIES: dihydroorotase [Streptomyces]|uniref:dihydroorotase n=1 Tax=Streptomyces lycopersici TaxID=2974589 RepID=UPI0021D0CA38|nr:dihydroorotase family protein [Streptomyces sp. NEAU-383]
MSRAFHHACCREEVKFGEPEDDVFLAKAGFGGAEYLLPGLLTEGMKRGLPLGRIAALTSWNPARRFGLRTKGSLAPGYDADIALVDPGRTWTVRAAESESAQQYTPFEGFELTAQVTDAFLRGNHILRAGEVIGPPVGAYLHRLSVPPHRRRGDRGTRSTAGAVDVTHREWWSSRGRGGPPGPGWRRGRRCGSPRNSRA